MKGDSWVHILLILSGYYCVTEANKIYGLARGLH
jgi:hypothetical protein